MNVVVSPPAKVVAKVSSPKGVVAKVQPNVRKLTVKMSGAYVLAPPIGEGVVSFTHTQSTPASIWSIPNPFGSAEVADVTFKDEFGKTGLIDWSTPSLLYVVITFPIPRIGKAYLRKA